MSDKTGQADTHAPASPALLRQPLADPWEPLRRWTSARIALGRSGGSLPTRRLLDFRLAHARARDAVWQRFDADALAQQVRGVVPEGRNVIALQTRAPDRATFLTRPDLGRELSAESREALREIAAAAPDRPDLAVILSDGLSPAAAHAQIAPVLAELLPLLAGWKLAPLSIVPYGRVALQDEIGELLGARLALILLGERPGLGSPDSLGAYLVHDPKLGNTDAQRHCVSNIRPEGLSPARAARKLRELLGESLRLGSSGVPLRETPEPRGALPSE